MKLNIAERMSFGNLLPVQGNLQTLELVDQILRKVRVEDAKEEEREFHFDPYELLLMNEVIQKRDQAGNLPFQCLSLVRKILKGE